MKKVIVLALASLLSTCAMADVVVSQYGATVDTVNCVQVGQNESLGGGLVGGALGGAGGAIVGSMFGRKGKLVGGLLGAAGGAAYGASGDKIYNCSIMAVLNQTGDKVMVTKQTTEPLQQGQGIGVVQLSNGKWEAL